MKLARFRYMDEDRIGVALGNSLIVDLHEAAVGLKLPFNFPFSMRELINFDSVAQESIRFLVYQCQRYPHRIKPIPLTEIEWLPPLKQPGKILCVEPEKGERPQFFLKPSSSLIGHLQPIEIYDYYGRVTPQPRLAVVIGRVARHVDAAEALSCVYGYTIFNDVTGNDMAAEDLGTLSRSNGCDTFGPMGPWLVTTSEISDPNDLEMSCTLNGESILKSAPIDLKQSIEKTIAFISKFQTLEPGDVVCFGLDAASGQDKKNPADLIDLQSKNGLLTISINGIGELSNPITQRSD